MKLPEGVSVSDFKIDPETKGHQFFIMKNSGASALAHL